MPFATDQEFTITQLTDKLWRLEKDLVYYDSKHTDLPIPIEKGYVCDGSSIPRPVWSIIGHPLSENHGIVGFLHDKLYGSLLWRKLISRKLADLIYLEAHKDLGTPFWKRQTAYHALRWFGWIPYQRRGKS